MLTNYFDSFLFNKKSSAIIIAISLGLVLVGNYHMSYLLSLAGVSVFWVYGMAYGVLNIYYLYGYAMMQFMLFVFILSRPLLASVYDVTWTYWDSYTIEHALLSVYVCEVTMFLGSRIFKQRAPQCSCSLKVRNNNKQSIQIALLMLVVLTGIVEAYVVCRNYLEFRNLGYEVMYVKEVYYPAIIRGLSTLFPLAVFGYLATMPGKTKSILVLLLYISLGTPTFLLGNRTSIVLRIAFATVYFFIRDYTREQNESRWITKWIKIGFVIFVVFAIAFLGAYNYIRTGKRAADQTYLPIMADFFYRQGTSFDTVCQGFFYEPIIRGMPETISYSLGGVIDSVKHSTLSQMLFGTSSLGNVNSVNMVVNGNSLAHRLSYVVFGEKYYLEGHGRGSSFILETYYDGGFPLIGLYSFALGVFLSNINRIVQKKSWFINTIVITSMSYIYMIPRASACSFATFLVTPHFWMMIIYVLTAIAVAERRIPWIKYR